MTLRVSLGKNYNAGNAFLDADLEFKNKKNSTQEEVLKELLNRGSFDQYHDDIQGFIPSQEKLFSIISTYFPITNDLQTASVSLKSIQIKKPTMSYKQTQEKQLTYAVGVHATFNLILFNVDEISGTRSVNLVKTQEVYLFDLPIMTFSGNFLVNGVERVIISQIHRSPGVIFSTNIDSLNQQMYLARIIPYQGSWLDFEIEHNDNFICRVNKKRKFSVINILSLFDVSREDAIDIFYGRLSLSYSVSKKLFEINQDSVKKLLTLTSEFNLAFDIIDEKGQSIISNFTNITPAMLSKHKNLYIMPESLAGHGIISNSKLGKEGSVLEDKYDSSTLKSIKADFDIDVTFTSVYKTPLFSSIYSEHYSREDSLKSFFRTIRPGSQFSIDDAERLFIYTFQNKATYNITEMGRIKLNEILEINIPLDNPLITKDDVVGVIKKLLHYKKKGVIDLDVDSLTNRRVRLPSELIENSIKSGISKLSRSILEKLNSVSLDNVLLSSIISGINHDIREFFLLSQFSQLEDQTNPLARIAHKRRISSLGPGGISKSSGGSTTFRVRDVHPTHYGRICPIETPEGQNIGLIVNLAIHAKLDKYGFINTPFVKVVNKKITNQVHYFAPGDDYNHYITTIDQTNFNDNEITSQILAARYQGEIIQAQAEMIEYVDFRSNQLISVGASLIPFIENTDASRALMGSNMQRQALPLLKPQTPLVGTGVETLVAQNTHDVIRARNAGVVQYVSADTIAILIEKENQEPTIDIYKVFDNSSNNGGTVNSKRPIVSIGQKVNVGDILTDGPSITDNEIALGQNLLVGFMPWNGYNFEDSIIISEKVCASGVFESLHISEHITFVKDTRVGPEELTRNIPGVDSADLRHLDESGIIMEGSYVEAGDIIVGKVAPKVQDLLTPEEKLLKAIFGEKGGDRKDVSMTVPAGIYGTVIGVKILTKRGYPKCERAIEIEHLELMNLAKERDIKVSIIYDYCNKLADEILLQDGYSKKDLDIHIEKKFGLKIKDKSLSVKLESVKTLAKKLIAENKKRYDQIASIIVEGDELQQGNLSVVKVYIATKRNLQPGDKMAGRHGNKGVISKILPVEDMPFLEDGTPLDIVLSSLGIPSRMNIGQILETHLGLVSKTLGKRIDDMLQKKKSHDEVIKMVKNVVQSKSFEASLKKTSKKELQSSIESWAKKGVPFMCQSFGGFSVDDITAMYKKLGLDESGQTYLYDGLTGEKFKRKITVGYIYMLKLHHIVDEKIHARSVGSYSLITQQPLGGRSNFGGQRFGEMECWALQAYGAAYTLQEMLTVKSDDVDGRSRMYESVIKGDISFTYGTPESFKVLVRELNSLAINLTLESDSW